MAFGVDKVFFALRIVRNSRLWRRRGLVMEGTLTDMRMYGQVILLPTQSLHVCVCGARILELFGGFQKIQFGHVSQLFLVNKFHFDVELLSCSFVKIS